MAEWEFSAKSLKLYPHFDSQISVKDARVLATNPAAVTTHSFYPFLLYSNRWTRFAEKGKSGNVKIRPIRYAARGDAYIFSYYRHLLAEKYEEALCRFGLDSNVLAYRRIRDADGAGKCNIHFARDAFNKIKELESCCAVALDISGFFEHLDHQILKDIWCELIGHKKLPPDHFKIFKAITSYSVVEKQAVYERLGYYGPKNISKHGKVVQGYLKPYAKMPKQLCTGKQFREKIAGGDGSKSLVKVNRKPYGIPQGSPISDLLANMYLLHFDRAVLNIVNNLGGAYYRYSDDILLIVPGGETEGKAIAGQVRGMIFQFGSKLEIKESKSSVFVFAKSGGAQDFQLVQGSQGRNGIEYLGFRFDGKNVFIRDSTLSNLYRKITRSSRFAAVSLAKRYPRKNYAFLEKKFDFEKLIQRFGRVDNFGELAEDFRNWTFWTYARRASKIFGPAGERIHRQLREHRQKVRLRAVKEMERVAGA